MLDLRTLTLFSYNLIFFNNRYELLNFIIKLYAFEMKSGFSLSGTKLWNIEVFNLNNHYCTYICKQVLSNNF